MFRDKLILVKGGGDLATGVAHRLHQAGFPVVIAELPQPMVVRRAVAFASAVYDGTITVEGVTARRVTDAQQARRVLARGEVAVLIDPHASAPRQLRPYILVDAIMAKQNTGTRITDAPIVIALGPGFQVGRDAHAVIETLRGHHLGRVYWSGHALDDTGVPDRVLGYDEERVLRAPRAGVFRATRSIGDTVNAGDVVGWVDGAAVTATIGGVMRGLLADGLQVTEGLKLGDIDPRGLAEYCFTISDKARAVGGGVLEAVLKLSHVSSPTSHVANL